MEREELERILEEREVLNTLGRVRRDLQRPIPDHIPNKGDYNHSRKQYTCSLGGWMRIYDIQLKKGLDIEHENFLELSERNKRYYNFIVGSILDAINDGFICI